MDGTVLAVFTLLAWVLPLSWPSGEPVYPAWPGSVGFAVLAAGAVLTRRCTDQRQLAVLAIIATATAVLLCLLPGVVVTFDDPTNLWLASAAAGAPYAAALYRQDRSRAWIMLGALTVVVARPWASSWTLVTISLSYVTVPMLFGMYLRARHAMVTALTERAERAKREQHLLARRARADERARLASEMHDIVTHRITLMVLHTGALQVTEPDPTCRRIAEQIRGTGSLALAELRDLIGVLRSPRPAEDSSRDGREVSPDGRENR